MVAFLEPTLIRIMRINAGRINLQTTLNFFYKINMGHNNYLPRELMWKDLCFFVLLLMYGDYFILYKVLVGILH